MDRVGDVLFDLHPDPMWIFDSASLRFLAVNRAAVLKYGWTREEFLAMTIRDIRPPQDVPALLRAVRPPGFGRDEAGVWRHRTRSGALLHVDVVSHTIEYAGRPAELVSARDVSRLVQLNAELAAATELLGIASQVAKLGAWRVVLPGPRVEWSAETAAIHEMPDVREVPVEQGIEFYAPEYRDRIRAVFEACARDGRPYDEVLQIVTATGRRVWVRSIGVAQRGADGRIVAVRGAFQDISAERAREDQARVSEERFKLVASATSDVIWDWDLAAGTLWWSEGLRTLFGYDPAAVESTIDWWSARVHADDRERAVAGLNAAVAGDGHHWLDEYRFLHADGRVLTVIDRGYAIRDREGRALRMVGSIIDVTERRELDARLRQSQKLEAMGQLTGGVAHDFNNLLTVILGNAELLGERLAGQPALRPLAEMTAKAAERGAELTNRLLAFARRQALAPKRVDLGRLVAGMNPLLRRALAEEIEIHVVPHEALWTAEVDPGQLEVALLNLALNARDAMRGSGKLTIATANATLDASYARGHQDVRPGDYVVVSVSDTGCGMSAEVAARAFEPFFTTKEVGKGSGLGLSMVYGFVRQSGGHAKIYSEPGIGTTVRLYFPRAPRLGDEDPDEERAPRARGGTEHVLVVEDDVLVREHVVGSLESLGYRVTSAADGPEALAVLARTPDVDLLFTDIVMPGGLNGRELAAQALAARPDLRVLYTSGYSEDAIVHHGRLDPGVLLLSKPYRLHELAAKVRAVLDGPRPAPGPPPRAA